MASLANPLEVLRLESHVRSCLSDSSHQVMRPVTSSHAGGLRHRSRKSCHCLSNDFGEKKPRVSSRSWRPTEAGLQERRWDSEQCTSSSGRLQSGTAFAVPLAGLKAATAPQSRKESTGNEFELLERSAESVDGFEGLGYAGEEGLLRRANGYANGSVGMNEDSLDVEQLRSLEEWLFSKEVCFAADLGEADLCEQRKKVEVGLSSVSIASPSVEKLPDLTTSGATGKIRQWWDRIQNSVSPRVRGLLLLNLLTLLYGSNISLVKEAEGGMDPMSFALGRFAIATLAFLPFLREAFSRPEIRRPAMELGFWGALGYLSQALGVVTTDAGRASFISTFTVIEVPIIAGLFGAKIPKVTWAAAAAAICGVSLLETTGGKVSLAGDIWTLLSAFWFGVHMLRSEHISKRLPLDGAFPFIGLQLLTITAFAGAASLGEHVYNSDWGLLAPALQGDWATLGADTFALPWLPMLFTGLMSTAFCLWIECVSLRDVSATEAAMVYTLEPLYGAAFAWLLLGERWGLKGWAGAGLILGGSLAMQLFGQEGNKKEEGEPVVAAEGAIARAAGPEGSSSPSSSTGVAAALAAAAIITAMAAASAPRGGGSMASVEEGAWQAGLLADSLDLVNVASLLRICAFTKLESDK
eukprot:TRINITY_DN190_c0_g2_i1.p1 TRINITY_DN190_c0_g2~~TRINITY_DN190_c0_g2_i1.p1  ORF type:complete len:639 (-),score=110.36 TRINITY_DN190_c0_g2_i1:591-2507(-)